MKVVAAFLTACVLHVSVPVLSAQPATNQNAPFVLFDGTPLKLRIGRTMSSKDAKTGETVDFEVLEDVKVNDVLVIPRGGTAFATVTEAQSARRMGRGGKLNINIDHVRLITGEKVALRAIKDAKGGGHVGAMTGAIVATAIVFFPAAPLFLFIKGKEITIPKGTEITAYVNGDINLNPKQFLTSAVQTAPVVSPSVLPVEAKSEVAQPTTQKVSTAPTAQFADAIGTETTSAVVFQSNPEGADIEVDGKFAGNTPSMLQLKVGDHKIAIKSPGYSSWERTIAVGAGGNVNINAILQKASVVFVEPTVATTPVQTKPSPEPTPTATATPTPMAVPVSRPNPEAVSVVTASVPAEKEVSTSLPKPGDVRKTRVGIELVWVSSGEFTMGSTDGEDVERPVRKVTISEGFWMSRYEVTQLQWFSEMGLNPSEFDKCGGNCPVENVSWDDAQRFIAKLNAKNDGFVYSLPTEAQWEYAARAGTTGKWAGDLGSMAWYSDNSGGRTQPVGTKQPNAFGLYDMHGNVWEWCEDWYGNYPRTPETDPKGPAKGKWRILRGGSWKDGKDDQRSAYRGGLSPSTKYKDMGFRVVAKAR